MTEIPDVVSRYYAAAASGEIENVLACFTDDAHVRDEQRDYRGLEEIRSWREGAAARFTYTTEITGAEIEGPGTYVVHTHLEGDFPGGVVDLEQRFTVAEGRISELRI